MSASRLAPSGTGESGNCGLPWDNTKLGLDMFGRYLSERIPSRRRIFSAGDFRDGIQAPMTPTTSSSFAHSEPSTVAWRGSPRSTLLNVVILMQAMMVARRPVIIRHPTRTFSRKGRLSVRTSLMGMRARVRSIRTKIAAETHPRINVYFLSQQTTFGTVSQFERSG